jgi:hypothetical protein
MDTGGLAQMTYNNTFSADAGLGMPNSGYAARNKAPHMKRLSVQTPNGLSNSQMNAQSDQGANGGPRISRGHLLAGLRTAPKGAGYNTSASASAPPTKVEFGLDSSRYANSPMTPRDRMNQPQSANPMSAGYHMSQQNVHYGQRSSRQMYSVPEQVLAPPQIQVTGDTGNERFDPKMYAELVATNMFLAQRQRELQDQLMNVQAAAAAQQLQHLQLNGMQQSQHQQLRYGTPPTTPGMNLYNGAASQSGNMQPVIQPVSGSQPGLYSIFNPATGHSSLYVDTNVHNQASRPTQHQHQYAASPAVMTPQSADPSQKYVPRFQQQQQQTPSAPSPRSFSPSVSQQRALSPPGLSTTPTFPPSSNASALAFRRGHKKMSSLSSSLEHVPENFESGPKTSLPRTAGYPVTPMTGTFAPGHNRSGEHPVREPRGPPPLEELVAKPTSKHEGSKNFATRQRRRAVNSLVRAGIERRGARGSSGSMTPLSESDAPNFSGSDNESIGSGSAGGLSSKPSLGSLRAARAGAIGSERKSSSVDSVTISEYLANGNENTVIDLKTPLVMMN